MLEENYKYFQVMVNKASIASGWTWAYEMDVLQDVTSAIFELESGVGGVESESDLHRYPPYDPDNSDGAAWLTYMHNVAAEIIRRHRNERRGDVVPLSRWHGEQWAKARRVRGELSQELLREPTNREVAEAMGLTIEQFEDLRMNADYEQVSGEDLASGDNDDACLGEDFIGFEETIEDTHVPTPEQTAETNQTINMIYKSLDQMDQTEAEVLRRYYGLGDYEAQTLTGIALELDTSRFTVARTLQRATDHLRGRLTLVGVQLNEIPLNTQ